MSRFDAEAADRSAELERRLERDASREPRTPVPRLTDEDRRESLRLSFASAFTASQDKAATDYDTTAEHAMDVQP